MFVWNQNKALSNEYQDIDDEELIDHCLHNFCFNLKNNYFMFECLYERIYNGVWKTNKLIPEKYYRWYKIMEKGNRAIEEFNLYIKEKYGVDVTLILSAEDDKNIYEKINAKKLLNKRLKKKR